MGSESGKTQNQVKRSKLKERRKDRWLMVFYDSLVYLLCWLAIFVVRPLAIGGETDLFAYLLLAAGYVLFFGFRFVFRCYKQIWRYGAIRAFFREFAAGLSGAACLTLLCIALQNTVLPESPPYILLISFMAVYVLASLGIRIGYFYLYHWALGKSPASRKVRLLLRKLGRVKITPSMLNVATKSKETEIPVSGPINKLKHLAESFVIHGTVTNITQINKGYINQTYRVETLSEAGHVHKYTLQRINTNVFPDVDALMDNFKLTTDHLRDSFLLPGHGKKGSVQTVRLTKDGKTFLRDDSGCWRMMTYFDHVYSLDIPDSPETFYHAGCAFGRFLKEMSDVDISQVKEVIPNFHNTKSRYMDLEEAIARDPKNRVKDVAEEIDFVRARADKYGLISDALESGKIPTRICHNDCNLNNILFDNETHLPVAVIDLDTVMPSSPLYDYGDSMRIGTNTAKDDEKDLSKVSCDLNLYKQYARGYLSACGDVLTKEELELLPYSSLIISSEDGIRFLADYINGDTYYNIYYPEQNLDRARTQLKLVEDMEEKLPEIKRILVKIYTELGLQAQID